MKLSALVDRALGRLSEDTWIKHDFADGLGNHCFLGHIAVSYNELANLKDDNAHHLDDMEFVYSPVAEWWEGEGKKKMLGLPFSGNVADWNDRAQTSFEDAVLGMKHLSEWTHEHDIEIVEPVYETF